MRKWGAGAMFVAMTLIYCSSLTRAHAVNDVRSTALASWRIANTGHPWLEGIDYTRLAGMTNVWVEVAANGHAVSFRSPGPIVAGIPGYLVARAVGFDRYSLLPNGISAAILTTLALFLLFLAIRPRLGTVAACAVVAVLGLTTPVWSVSADAMWTHPLTILGICGMAWSASRERWWLLGLFGGVAIWGRLHTALIVAILGLALSWLRRSPRVAVVVGAVSGAFLALVAVWSHWMYGTWSLAGGYSVSGYTDRATSASSLVDRLVNHLGLWVSPDRGILVWTPMLVLLLPALVRGWRDLPDWSRWLLIGGIAYTLVQGQLNGFSGGSGFYGYRLTLETLMCAAPAYAFSLERAGTWARRLLGPVIGLQFGAFALGSIGQGGILNEEHLWTQNAYVYALVHYPVLIVWLLLTVWLGWAAGKVARRRLSSAGPVQAGTVQAPAS